MICVRVHDHREKPGYVACTIAVSSFLLIQCNLTVYFTSGIWDWAAWNYWSKLFDTHLCYYSWNENIISVLNTVGFLVRVYICIYWILIDLKKTLNINGSDMVAEHLYATIYTSAKLLTSLFADCIIWPEFLHFSGILSWFCSKCWCVLNRPQLLQLPSSWGLLKELTYGELPPESRVLAMAKCNPSIYCLFVLYIYMYIIKCDQHPCVLYFVIRF